MVDFRRWITAIAVLALFAGLASAQTGGSGQLQLTCSTNVTATPQLRAEGYTEQTGDITITCTGGSNASVTPGNQIPQVNITVFLNTAVTSRLIGSTTGASEALLLIDEPGSGIGGPVANFGPNANQSLCPTPLTGCIEYAADVGAGALVASNSPSLGTGVVATTQGYNVFQGIVNGNAVTFFGVPVLPPVSTGISRVFRITNVRANATTLSGGSAAGATPVVASISTSNSSTLPITQPTPTVGFVQGGLSATATGVSNFNQCASQTRASVAVLSFGENFGTAFKTRVAALTDTAYAGQGTNPTGQNIPGNIYNSESNFIFPVASGTAGLADFGTRLKATFNNVPSGVRLFVSVNNVINGVTGLATSPATVGGKSTLSYAQLVTSETASDGAFSSGTPVSLVTATDNAPGSSGTIPVAEIAVTGSTASAVWEVLNTNPNSQETFRFAVYATYTSNVAQNSPPAGTATVNLSFAPTPPSFTAAAGAAASSSLTIPRFIADPSAARNLLAINICRTILLYPFVTNQAGFDTGLAIANTSTDPFGTGPQAGSCALNWYSGTGSPSPTNTGSIASGTVYTTLASTTVPNFQGYMIAVCQFQYAHGFAFISDLGARNLAMGYLALVIPDPTTQNNNVRNASANGCSSSNSDIKCSGGEEAGH
jgi:hypothetical protein